MSESELQAWKDTILFAEGRCEDLARMGYMEGKPTLTPAGRAQYLLLKEANFLPDPGLLKKALFFRNCPEDQIELFSVLIYQGPGVG